MKKRLLVTIICAVMGTVGITGCGQKDPKEALEEVMVKAAEVEDIDMSTSMKISMKAEGEKMNIPMDMDIKVKGSKSDTVSMEMKMNMEAAGQEVNLSAYYQAGYYYMDMSGQKVKYPMDVAAINKQIESSMNYQELTADMYQDVTMEKDGDNKVYSFKGNLDKMSDYLKDSVSSLKDTLSQDIEFAFSDLVGTVTVDKSGEMAGISMDFNMDMTIQGQTITARAESDSKINATGDKVNVTIPNTDEYEEIAAP